MLCIAHKCDEVMENLVHVLLGIFCVRPIPKMATACSLYQYGRLMQLISIWPPHAAYINMAASCSLYQYGHLMQLISIWPPHAAYPELLPFFGSVCPWPSLSVSSTPITSSSSLSPSALDANVLRESQSDSNRPLPSPLGL